MIDGNRVASRSLRWYSWNRCIMRGKQCSLLWRSWKKKGATMMMMMMSIWDLTRRARCTRWIFILFQAITDRYYTLIYEIRLFGFLSGNNRGFCTYDFYGLRTLMQNHAMSRWWIGTFSSFFTLVLYFTVIYHSCARFQHVFIPKTNEL